MFTVCQFLVETHNKGGLLMKTLKQWLCLCLSLIMVLSLLPASLFTRTVQAAEERSTQEDTATSKAPTRAAVSA